MGFMSKPNQLNSLRRISGLEMARGGIGLQLLSIYMAEAEIQTDLLVLSVMPDIRHRTSPSRHARH